MAEKESPWLAALLNLLILGLGFIYLKKWFYFFAYWAIAIVFIVSGYGWQSTALLVIVSMIHSYYIAEKK